jgi:hypothetical protein
VIWLTWRQHRVILIVGTLAALALVVWMLVVEHDYIASRTAIARSCPAFSATAPTAECQAFFVRLEHAANQASIVRGLLIATPLFAGVLLGAPLVAGELEHDTVLLAFTQGISRTRWLVIRWLTLLASVVVVTSLFTLFANWWFWHVGTGGSISNAGIFTGFSEGVSRIVPGTFDGMGIVPIAYAIFALALGTAIGAVLRRTIWAALVTIGSFVAVRLSVEHWVRPHLVAPLFQPEQVGAVPLTTPLTSAPVWVVSNSYRDLPGSTASLAQASVDHVSTLCSQTSSASGVQVYGYYDRCLAAHGLQFGTYYQPSSRFWTLQWGEAAIFVAASVMLFGIALWAVRRWRA